MRHPRADRDPKASRRTAPTGGVNERFTHLPRQHEKPAFCGIERARMRIGVTDSQAAGRWSHPASIRPTPDRPRPPSAGLTLRARPTSADTANGTVDSFFVGAAVRPHHHQPVAGRSVRWAFSDGALRSETDEQRLSGGRRSLSVRKPLSDRGGSALGQLAIRGSARTRQPRALAGGGRRLGPAGASDRP